MPPDDRRRGPATWLVLAGIGGALAVGNLAHLAVEPTLPAIVLGGTIPFALSVGVVAIGLVGYRRAWSARATRRLLVWLTFGIGWMALVGVGTFVYQLSEGGLLDHRGYLLVTFASYGTVPALITGYYDVQRRDRERQVDATNEALRRERDFLSRIEALADVGGWELDLATDTVRWTEGGRSIRGITTDDGRSLEESFAAYRGEDRRKVERAIEGCRTDGIPFDVEVRLHAADGRVTWVQLLGERVEADEGPVLRGVIRDVSGQKERQQRLAVINRILRHNLRNDLTVIAGNADLLERDLAVLPFPDGGVDGERLQETARTIEATSQEILSLVEKTQRFEEAIRADVVVRQVDLRSLIEDLVRRFEREHPHATIDVDAPAPTVTTDPAALRTILSELVENAIDHHDAEHPRVAVEVGTDAADAVAITVADDGPGIPEMERTAVTGGEETALVHGSGIGLWIVDWMTTRTGGSIRFEDGARGTRVVVTIPRADRR